MTDYALSITPGDAPADWRRRPFEETAAFVCQSVAETRGLSVPKASLIAVELREGKTGATRTYLFEGTRIYEVGWGGTSAWNEANAARQHLMLLDALAEARASELLPEDPHLHLADLAVLREDLLGDGFVREWQSAWKRSPDRKHRGRIVVKLSRESSALWLGVEGAGAKAASRSRPVALPVPSLREARPFLGLRWEGTVLVAGDRADSGADVRLDLAAT